MKIARYPSRYGLPLSQYWGFFLPIQCEPFTCSTNVNGPVPITFFSYQRTSFARMSALKIQLYGEASVMRNDASGHLSRKRMVWASGASMASTARYCPLRYEDVSAGGKTILS